MNFSLSNSLAPEVASHYAYRMILHYHMGEGTQETGTVDVDSLDEFLEWLASTEIGDDSFSQKSVEEFSEAYRDMATTGKARILFAKPFEETHLALTIDRVEF